MSMNIYALPGARVTFSHPTSGYDNQQKTAAEYLQVGATYTVQRTDVHGWHTDVFLCEVPDVSFNSALFDDQA